MLSLHANESRASFAIGDHVLNWLKEQPPQRVTRTNQAKFTPDDVVFVVMASEARKERIVTQRASWMRWAEHILIFADVDDPELGIITLSALANRAGFGEAQWRQLHGMRWLYQFRRDLMSKSWFVLVDDDTWVNVPSLLEYVTAFPPRLPLSFSHIYLRHNTAVYNGGAGMLFFFLPMRLSAESHHHFLPASVLWLMCHLPQCIMIRSSRLVHIPPAL